MDERERARPNEKRGLDKLFRLSVIGSVIIVLVYSIYYYSNAHRQLTSKIVSSVGTSPISLVAKPSMPFATDNNALYSPIYNCLFGVSSDLTFSAPVLSEATDSCGSDLMFSNSYTLVKGSAGNDVVGQMFSTITQKFGTPPPKQMDKKTHDYIVYGVHYQNYSLPYHVLVNWRNQQLEDFPHKRYAYYAVDSVAEHFKLINDPKKIVRFERPDHGDHAFLAEWREDWEGQTIEALATKVLPQLVFGGQQEKEGIVRFPLMDFQWSHDLDVKDIKVTDEEGEHELTFAGFETKALLGPNLKVANAYELDLTNASFHDFKPPMLVIMMKDDASSPYLAAFIKDDALLID